MTIASLASLPRSQDVAVASSTPSSSGTAANSLDDANENVFLQLLVAQIQNQDPTNPTDSTTFVTQLAQFSSLEQLVAMRTDLDTLTSAASSGSQNHNVTEGAY